MEYYGIATSCVLFLIVICGRRPITGLVALIASCFCAFPVAILSAGPNSAVWVPDVTLCAVMLRWLPTIITRVLEGKKAPGMYLLWIIFVIVILGRIVFFLRVPTVLSVYQFSFFSLRFLGFILIYYITALLPIDRDDFRKLLSWISILTIGLAVANIISKQGIVDLHFYMGSVLQQDYLDTTSKADIHACLLGFNRASVGLFMYLGIFALLLRSWLGGAGGKVVLYIGLPLLASLLLDSFSRAAVLAIIVGFPVLVVRNKTKNFLSLLVALTIGGGVIALFSTSTELWQERFAALFSLEAFRHSTGQGRLADWGRLLDYMIHNPEYLLSGSGFYGYQYVYTKRATLYFAAHNMYLHTLGELGIVGLALFMMFWGKLLLLFSRLSKQNLGDSIQRIACNTIFALHAGVLVSGLSQESLYPNSTMYMITCTYMIMFAATFSAFGHPMAGREENAYPDILDPVQRRQLMEYGYV